MADLIKAVIELTLAITPAILVVFSSHVPGKARAFWSLGALVLPFIAESLALLACWSLLSEGYGLIFEINTIASFTWYIFAWGVFSLFRFRYTRKKISSETT